MNNVKTNLLTKKVIGAAIEVHRRIGPGLLESVYESCFEYELNLQGIKVERQVLLPIMYKQFLLAQEYRIDLLVEDKIVIEVKSINEVSPVHQAQLLTYLKLRGGGVGLLMNFNVCLLKEGIYRLKV